MEDEYVLHHLQAKSGAEPYLVNLVVEGKIIQMEVDTGAAVLFASEETFRQLWPEEIKYSGKSLPILGELEVSIAQGSQVKVLPLLVLKGKGPSLHGRN